MTVYIVRSHTGEPWHRYESDQENIEHEDEEDIVNEKNRRYQLHMEKVDNGINLFHLGGIYSIKS